MQRRFNSHVTMYHVCKTAYIEVQPCQHNTCSSI